MEALSANAALIIIDVQKGFDDPRWGMRNNPDAEKRIADLLKAWRALKRPVVYVQHLSKGENSPLRSGQSGSEIKEIVQPIGNEPIFQKQVNSAFIGTKLESYLKENRIETVVIVGLTTDHCVSTTTRMAGNLGFTTYIVDDATATFDKTGPNGKHYSADLIHDTALTSLHQEFATVVSTKDLLGGANDR